MSSKKNTSHFPVIILLALIAFVGLLGLLTEGGFNQGRFDQRERDTQAGPATAALALPAATHRPEPDERNSSDRLPAH